jgi:predicted dehydrogenase
MKAVGFGIVSPGRWGKRLLESVRGSERLELLGVSSRSRSNAESVAQAFGGRVFETYEAMLSSGEIEGVLIATPHHLHHPQALAALRAGKHVFVEKPVANSLAEAEELRRVAEEGKLVVSVGLQMRRAGAFRRAHAMIETGEIGTVVMAVAMHGAPIPATGPEDWKHAAISVPAGPLDQLGVHYGDLFRYLLGPVRRVSGFTTSAATQGEIPDAAVVSLQFATGVLGVYTTHQVSAYASELRIFATKGILHIRRAGRELAWQPVVDTRTAQRAGAEIVEVPFEGPHPHSTALTEELEEWADCVRSGRKPEVGAEEGIEALRIMRAAVEANESGRTVELAGG